MRSQDLGQATTARIVGSCRGRVPDAAGILVHGSYATGLADESSDLDLVIVSEDIGDGQFFTWFERVERALLHVSASAVGRVEFDRRSQQPADWAFGLPVALEYVWLWVGEVALESDLGRRPVVHLPPAPAEIEDLVEAAVKVRRRATDHDELGVRQEAQALARAAAPTVAALNRCEPVADPRQALERVLSLPVAPPNWGADLTICLGLAGAPSSTVRFAAQRLAHATLRLVRELDPGVDTQPDISRYITDGTFERRLAARA